MFFSLFNIPASFQGYINMILARKLDFFVIVYLDNILIYTNKADYINAIWKILNQLRKHFLYANLNKYHFYQKEMQFLDYVISL